jgi:hypothetical protein
MLSALGSFAVSFLTRLALDWIEAARKTARDQETGRLRSELEHALEAIRTQHAIAEIAVKLNTRADVLARLEEGSV